MFSDIIKIAILCVVIGGASIPVSFSINSSPWVVWLGNALGSLFSAFVVIYVGNRITSGRFRDKMRGRPVGNKVVTVFEEGEDNQKVQKARVMINKRGLKVFAFICPIFPGVLVATTAVYMLDLDKETYKRWMFPGIFFASGMYVFGYWYFFVK